MKRLAWFVHPDSPARGEGLVIGGASRSGTTLLRVMLDSHSAIASGPESGLFIGRFREKALCRNFDISRAELRILVKESSSYSEFVIRFLRAYAIRMGKKHWAEKTPENVLYIEEILRRFPEVTFCHVVRDPRAVINSMRSHPRFRVDDGRLVPTGERKNLASCTDRWVEMVTAGLSFDGHPRVHRIHYEDLVRSSSETLSPLLARLGLQWEGSVADFHEVRSPSRDVTRFPQNPEATRPLSAEAVERWKHELTLEEIAYIEERTAALRETLAYV